MTGKHKKRGFSLIEAAIVLAVVGLVIGGIWVAAAAMYETYKVNKTVEGIFTTARNIQNLISIRDAEAFGQTQVDITSTVRSANAFPKEWLTPIGQRNIFGTTVTAKTTSVGPAGPRFGVEFGGMGSSDYPSISSCSKIVLKASSISAQAGSSGLNIGAEITGKNVGSLLRIYVGGDLLTSFPVSLSEANQKCAQNANPQNRVTFFSFTFGYTRTN